MISCVYRPYVKKFLYYDRYVNEMRYQMPSIFPDTGKENCVICFTDSGSEKPFMSLISNKMVDLHFTSPGTGSQCLPLHRYDENGNRIENITDWGLKQFRNHYKNRRINKEDIFYYVYAVLHNPAYREKYEQNLKRDMPRIPFYKNFRKWVNRGKRLADLHIGFESVEPWPLERTDLPEPKTNRPRLKADKNAGKIVLDSVTTLSGVPKIAWEYKLGTYPALQWVLEQHREKKIRDATVREKFSTYRFADHKERVIDLLMRVCTVSVRTMEILGEIGD